MKQKYLLYSMDGKLCFPIPITRDFRQWSDRKCWSSHCSNSIMIVHISSHGNATHGYCFFCFRAAMLFDCLYGYTDSGIWVECIKNYKTKKPILKERQDRKSFEKILIQKYGDHHDKK